jgi:hypothetical protein
MGRHVPLPEEPDAKAAEKRRRFKVYRREWQKRKRQRLKAEKFQRAVERSQLRLAARRANLDLCIDLDVSSRELRRALEIAKAWEEI